MDTIYTAAVGLLLHGLFTCITSITSITLALAIQALTVLTAIIHANSTGTVGASESFITQANAALCDSMPRAVELAAVGALPARLTCASGGPIHN